MDQQHPLTDEEQRRESRYFSMEYFHFTSNGRNFGGGGIPRFGTSYVLVPLRQPEPPEPPRREPTSSGERETMILKPKRDYEQTLRDYAVIPFQVNVYASLGAYKAELVGLAAKDFLLWIGGLIACPACAMTFLTGNTNNETCSQCCGPLLRCYDALVWHRSQPEVAAAMWVDLGSLEGGAYFQTEQGTRGILLAGDAAEDRGVVWAGSGETGRLPNETRVRAIIVHLPADRPDTEASA